EFRDRGKALRWFFAQCLGEQTFNIPPGADTASRERQDRVFNDLAQHLAFFQRKVQVMRAREEGIQKNPQPILLSHHCRLGYWAGGTESVRVFRLKEESHATSLRVAEIIRT